MKNLKKLFTALLLLCAVTVSAHDFEVDGIYYRVTDEANKTVEVTYKGFDFAEYSNEYSGDVVIPETVTYNDVTYSVTSIKGHAFYECTELISVTIPNSVTSIGNNAFRFCYGLTSIEIPNSVTSIGDMAFQGCSELASVTIGNSVTTIGSDAFALCSELTSIEIPNSVTSIGDDVFYGCSGLTSIVVGSENSVYDSRENCNAIIETATNTLMVGCMNTVIPNSVTTIGEYAFFNCDGLTSIEIPNSVTSLAEGAFYGCSALTSIEIPNSVTSIGKSAFANCHGLTSVELPTNVTSIANNLFYCCYELTNVIIPYGVESIGADAFMDCPALASIEIPNSVTSIGDCAFQFCTGLTSIEIPNSVTSIGDYAFMFCSGLTSITSRIAANNLFAPGVDAFYDVDKAGCTLYVPYTAKETYAATSGWQDFENIVELMPEDYDDNATEIEITIGQYGNTTFSSYYALDFSNVEGLKAYAATGYNSRTGIITMTKVETTAGAVGLFLCGDPGTYVVPVIKQSDDNSLNMLVGVVENSTVNSTSTDGLYANYKYTIKSGDSEPRFYRYADGSTVSAGKAYLQIPLSWIRDVAAEAIGIRFDDGETTGVDEINGENTETVYYDLQGRRVDQPTDAGIYIVNGKKVLVR